MSAAQPPRRLLFNAFSMNCVSHIHHGLWRRTDTRQLEYTSLEPWVDLARRLEAAGFDTLFLADVLGTYDLYRGSADIAIREAMQIPANDPSLLIPAMAHATRHLGFACTGSIYAEPPFNFARRASTLDHLTGGRVAWNIVTSYLPNAARNLGFADLPRHDDRYDRADDYLDVLYKLWEASWDDDAVVRDRVRGIFADPAKVHAIHHQGPYYQVEGPHLCEPSPQRTPLLFQAGSSDRGREFAARHTECVFITGGGRAELIADIRARAARYGRQPDDLRFCLGVSLVIGGTETEAQAKAKDLNEMLSVEGGLVHLSGHLGVDLGAFDPAQPIDETAFNGVLGFLKSFAAQTPHRPLTFGDLVHRQMSGQWLVGSAEQIADRLTHLAASGIDGFNLVYATTPGTFIDFIDGVAPILRQRGLMQAGYAEGTLREKVFGHARLPARHPGARHRRG
ncbi:MAG: LLM class flavin-dependent oxidoreductase [Gammaproteobacteria bacterium]